MPIFDVFFGGPILLMKQPHIQIYCFLNLPMTRMSTVRTSSPLSKNKNFLLSYTTNTLPFLAKHLYVPASVMLTLRIFNTPLVELCLSDGSNSTSLPFCYKKYFTLPQENKSYINIKPMDTWLRFSCCLTLELSTLALESSVIASKWKHPYLGFL